MAQGKWLKKYTKIKYLEEIIRNKRIHLGDPKKWEDKNDIEFIKLRFGEDTKSKVRATCMTTAKDRYHFWVIYGNRGKGVCLWFDKDSLIDDIKNDDNLEYRDLYYWTPEYLKKFGKKNDLPYIKRTQYSDEMEFRILRKKSLEEGLDNESFEFSKKSLKAIYLNPWIDKSKLKVYKTFINHLLSENEFKNVNVYQNRSLRYRNWIEAARSLSNQ